MQIPQIQGQVSSQNFIVYTACDRDYFDQFGKIFCHSVQQIGNAPVHVHLFNPTDVQLEWCYVNNVGVTWEFVNILDFKLSTDNLANIGGEGLRRSHVAMEKGNDTNLMQRIAKTYYACARFIRLPTVHKQCKTIFACDIDAVVRKPIPRLGIEKDFYIHQIFGTKARFLAGGLYLNPTANLFLEEYSTVLQTKICQDELYWSLDQDVLDPIVPRFNYGQLPETLIDWNMRSESVLWTAKGTRKENPAFIAEQQKYVA